jgi:hypothetical protein
VVRKYNPVEDLTPEPQHQRCSRSHSDFGDFDKADAFFWFIQSEDKAVGNITVKEINRRNDVSWHDSLRRNLIDELSPNVLKAFSPYHKHFFHPARWPLYIRLTIGPVFFEKFRTTFVRGRDSMA